MNKKTIYVSVLNKNDTFPWAEKVATEVDEKKDLVSVARRVLVDIAVEKGLNPAWLRFEIYLRP